MSGSTIPNPPSITVTERSYLFLGDKIKEAEQHKKETENLLDNLGIACGCFGGWTGLLGYLMSPFCYIGTAAGAVSMTGLFMGSCFCAKKYNEEIVDMKFRQRQINTPTS